MPRGKPAAKRSGPPGVQKAHTRRQGNPKPQNLVILDSTPSPAPVNEPAHQTTPAPATHYVNVPPTPQDSASQAELQTPRPSATRDKASVPREEPGSDKENDWDMEGIDQENKELVPQTDGQRPPHRPGDKERNGSRVEHTRLPLLREGAAGVAT